MDPMQPTRAAAVFIGLFSFCFGILVLALSPDKWQTFRKMVLAFFAIIFLLVLVGFTVAWLLPSIRAFAAELTGTLVLPMGLLWAFLTGWHRARSLKNPQH